MTKIPWSYRLYRLACSGIDLLFPPSCGGCGKLGSRWCVECQARVPIIREHCCIKCGLPLRNQSDLCESCRTQPPRYRVLRSWAVFDSPIQQALHTLKYRNNRFIADPLAVQIVDFVSLLGWSVDILVPIPLGRQRLKERGYNQVELVARPLAYELGLEFTPTVLKKVRNTRSQVGLTISQRKENVIGVYQADGNKVAGKSVLVMDDVATTGSTIQSAVQALFDAGARDVYAFTIARALSHHDLNSV